MQVEQSNHVSDSLLCSDFGRKELAFEIVIHFVEVIHNTAAAPGGLDLLQTTVFWKMNVGCLTAMLLNHMNNTLVYPSILWHDVQIIGIRRWLMLQCGGGSRIFQMGGRCFVANGGAHILFSGKKCMKLKEIGLKWGGARLLAPCYSKITIFLWIILNSIMKTSYFTYLRIFWDILYKIIF